MIKKNIYYIKTALNLKPETSAVLGMMIYSTTKKKKVTCIT